MTLAYKTGYRNGRADRLLGLRLLYAWLYYETEPEYKREYSRGYREGWQARDHELRRA